MGMFSELVTPYNCVWKATFTKTAWAHKFGATGDKLETF